MEHLDYRKHDAVSLAQLVRDGEITPAELLDAALDRAHAVNGKLNAITRYFTEIARERANGELSGPLAGVPFLLKDLGQEWAGTVSSAGSRALRNVTSAETAEVVQRWLDAGLVVFGRTNSPEFGIKPVTEPEAFGPTRNPWDLSRSPGVLRAVQRPRWPPGSCRWPRPATVVVRSGYRLPGAACSASNRDGGWCPPVRWCPSSSTVPRWTG